MDVELGEEVEVPQCLQTRLEVVACTFPGPGAEVRSESPSFPTSRASNPAVHAAVAYISLHYHQFNFISHRVHLCELPPVPIAITHLSDVIPEITLIPLIVQINPSK
jgi:hypothetical protein